MIKTNSLEEYQTLMCLINYCKSHEDCSSCSKSISSICKSMSRELHELNVVYAGAEITKEEKTDI